MSDSKYISEILVWVLYRIAEIGFQSLRDVKPAALSYDLGFNQYHLAHGYGMPNILGEFHNHISEL